MFNSPLFLICTFTFLIHLTECLVYTMRLAGVKTRQIAIAMSFVTSSLLVSRLSNMFQAPLLGSMVDLAILNGNTTTLHHLENAFRMIIFAGFLGSLVGMILTPNIEQLFQKAIRFFLKKGSIPKLMFEVLKPKNTFRFFKILFKPNFTHLKNVSLDGLPRGFLVINIAVTSIYTIGVLCSLLAGAYLPEMRATAIQLSGIINGMATILFTIFVDPSGARITDQTMHGERPESHVKSVVFFLQLGRLFGTLIVAQLLFSPFTHYIMWVTTKIVHSVN